MKQDESLSGHLSLVRQILSLAVKLVTPANKNNLIRNDESIIR